MHRLILGQSKTGKTSLLKQLIDTDPSDRVFVFGDVPIEHDVLFSPDKMRWNPLAEPKGPTFFAEAVKDAYGYDDLTTPVMSMYLSFLASALQQNHLNITDIPKFLTDDQYRKQFSYNDELTTMYWDLFDGLPPKDKRQETASTLNKFLTILLDPGIRKMLSVNNPKRLLSDMTGTVKVHVPADTPDTTKLMYSLILSYLQEPASVYIDDASLFAKGILSDRLNSSDMSLTVSLKYLGLVPAKLQDAMLGNCSTQSIFRISPDDNDIMSRPFPHGVSGPRLDSLPNFVYRKFPYDKLSPNSETIPLEN